MLQLFAALCMLIDHTAIALIENPEWLYDLFRFVGRMAMPIFAYKIAVGYVHTHSLNKYMLRMLGMTLLAQIPCVALTHRGNFWGDIIDTQGVVLLKSWNIGLTFMCALLVLHTYERMKGRGITHLLWGAVKILCLCMIGNNGDYGIYGIGTVVLFYAYLKQGGALWKWGVVLVLMTLLKALDGNDFSMQYFTFQAPAVLGLIAIKYLPDKGSYLKGNFFYWYYPGHIIALLAIKSLL